MPIDKRADFTASSVPEGIASSQGDKYVKAQFVAIAALLSLLGSTSGRAQVTIEVAKITCEQFLRSKITDPKYIFLWLSCYYNAKRNNNIIDPQALDKNYQELRSYCTKDLQMTVMQAVESTLGERKQSA